MKNIYISAFIVTICLLGLVYGCVSEYRPSTTTTSSDTLPYDEAMVTPGGWRYRGDFPQYKQNIAQHSAVIGEQPDQAQITYRSDIETKAGETRTNLFYITLLNVSTETPTPYLANIQTTLGVKNIPNGLAFVQEGEGYQGAGWRTSEVLVHIRIAAGIKPGDYTFQVAVNIDGKEYGQVPCAIKIVN